MSRQQLEAVLSGLAVEQLQELDRSWPLWARREQLPPPGDWTVWLLLGGRGSGKTRAGAQWVHSLVSGRSGPAMSPIALVGDTLGEARAVMVEGPSGLLSCSPSGFPARFESSSHRVVWPNGAEARLMSASDPESFRGPQFAAAWCDEAAKWAKDEQAWDMLQFGLRLGTKPRVLVTTTPRPTRLLRRLTEDERCVTVTMRTAENADNLAASFLSEIVGRYRGTRLGRQELDAELIDDRDDALFTHRMMDAAKQRGFGEPERIVVGVDPAVSTGAAADACGIVVAGAVGDRAVVLADHTVRGVAPLKWGRAVIAAFADHCADCVVVEVNQGGDLVRSLLHQIDENVPVKPVHAVRGKWLRAEPVAALYEQGRIAHAPGLSLLEDEMTSFEPDGRANGRSPDRLDALVWAITELLMGARTPRIRNT